MQSLRHYDVHLTAEASRVVLRPFHIAPDPRGEPAQLARVHRIVDTVLGYSEAECERLLHAVNIDFSTRHWQTKRIHLDRYAHIAQDVGLNGSLSETRRELIGAYFCHEYSYAAAAVMNPSMVPHTDQSGLTPGDTRFIMSIRTVGEGHISSIAFREGIVTGRGDLQLWPQAEITIAAVCDDHAPANEVTAHRPSGVAISGVVLFPFTPAQRNGLEDLRLTRFDDDSDIIYYGTYTAYSGHSIRSELLTTKDFSTFTLTPLSGDAARNKGMALFPRRIGGAYAMIGRQDGESIYYLQSDDLTHWQGGEMIMAPLFPWELVQVGNCGPPIELEEGWLLLTHGVGAMRKYAIGAALLDKKNPRKVLGRLREPLLSPSHENREGYVPNVVYSCGAMKHGDRILLPYGVADSSISFATVETRELLDALV